MTESINIMKHQHLDIITKYTGAANICLNQAVALCLEKLADGDKPLLALNKTCLRIKHFICDG